MCLLDPVLSMVFVFLCKFSFRFLALTNASHSYNHHLHAEYSTPSSFTYSLSSPHYMLLVLTSGHFQIHGHMVSPLLNSLPRPLRPSDPLFSLHSILGLSSYLDASHVDFLGRLRRRHEPISPISKSELALCWSGLLWSIASKLW